MRRRGSDTSYQIEGARNASIDRRIDALEEQIDSGGSGGTGGAGAAPSICLSGFYISGAEERLKRGVRPEFCVEVPAGTERINTIIIKVSDATTDASYKRNRISAPYEITDGRTHLEYKFDVTLDYLTQFRLIRVVASDEGGNRTFFPSVEQAFNDSVPAALLFTTPEQFGVPSSPRLADILLNSLDSVTEDFDVKVRVRVFAPLSSVGTAQSWGAAGVDQVMSIFTRVSTGDKIGHHQKHLLTDTELTQVDPASPTLPNRGFVDLDFTGFKPGAQYSWNKNVAWQSGNQKSSSGPPVVFNAGNFSQDPSTLIGQSLTIIQDDSRRASVTYNYTQPAAIVATKWVRVERKITGDSDLTYETLIKKFSLQGDEFYTAGAHSILLDATVKTKPSKRYTWRVTVRAIGNATTVSFTQDTLGSETLDIPAASLQTTHKNLIEGGGFLNNANSFGTGSNDQVGRQMFVAPNTGSTRIDRTTTFAANGIGWDDANHRIKMGTNIVALGSKFCSQFRKRVLPGSTFNFNLLIRASTLVLSRNFTADLFDEGSGSVIPGATLNKNLGLKSGNYRIFWGVFNVAPGYTMSGRQWFRFYPTSDAGHEIYLDNVCLNRGSQFKLWEPGDGEASLDSDFNVIVDTGSETPGSISAGFYDADGTFFQVATNPSGIVTLSTAT